MRSVLKERGRVVEMMELPVAHCRYCQNVTSKAVEALAKMPSLRDLMGISADPHLFPGVGCVRLLNKKQLWWML
jgi:hypothetical protein